MEAKVGKQVDRVERSEAVGYDRSGTSRGQAVNSYRDKVARGENRKLGKTIRSSLGDKYGGERELARMRDTYRARQNWDGHN